MSDRDRDDRNDPPEVGTDADDGPRGALNVATEGESFLGDEGPDLEPLTPGDVDPENALFVVLGAAFTLFIVGQLVL